MLPFQKRTETPRSNESELDAPPRPPFVTRHSSTSSGDLLGIKIQRHLDAGNPLYIGFDPADPPRDSTLSGEAGRAETGRSGVGLKEGERGEGGHTTTTDGERRKSHWRRRAVKVISCGAPLDVCARIILTMGMTLALLSLIWAVNSLIQCKEKFDPSAPAFNSYLTIFQCVWGTLFGAACMFGFVMMWGGAKYRRSPTAALFFTITWILVTGLLLLTSILWFYFYFISRRHRFAKCREKTTTVSPGSVFDKDTPVRQATKEQIDNCLARAGKRGGAVLVWGIVYAVMWYAGIIVVAWGRDYRRRLLEIQECEERAVGGRNVNTEGDKVGLLLGTAPLGRLAHSRRMTIGPKRSELGPEADRPKNTIVRISGTVRMAEILPPAAQERSSSNSSTDSMGLGISVQGRSFVGNSSSNGWRRDTAY